MESQHPSAREPQHSTASMLAAVGTWVTTWPGAKLQRAGLIIAAIASAWFITYPEGEPQRITAMVLHSTLALAMIWVGRPSNGVAAQFLATAMVAFGAYIVSQVAIRFAWRADPFGPLLGVVLLAAGVWTFFARPVLTVAQLLGVPAIITAVFMLWWWLTYSSHEGLMFETIGPFVLAFALLGVGVRLCRLRSGPLSRRLGVF